jgi:hypothetical protein
MGRFHSIGFIFAMTRACETIEVPAQDPKLTPGFSPPLRTLYGVGFDHVATPSQPIVGVVRDKDTGKPIPGVVIQSKNLAGSDWPDLRTIKELLFSREKLTEPARGVRPYWRIDVIQVPAARDYLEGIIATQLEAVHQFVMRIEPILASFQIFDDVGQVSCVARGPPTVTRAPPALDRPTDAAHADLDASQRLALQVEDAAGDRNVSPSPA